MQINKSVVLIASSILLITGAVLILIAKRLPLPPPQMNCTAVMEIRDTEANFNASLNVMMILNPDGLGLIDLSGIVLHNDEKFNVSREFKFTYVNKRDDVFKITNMTLVKHAPDSVSDSLMEHSFFSMEQEEERLMILTKMRNAYIIGTLQSPVFICVTKF